MGHAEWQRIAQDIRDNYDNYDAFLILHGRAGFGSIVFDLIFFAPGTDTMAFTASALSFMLEYLEKPVILTGTRLFVQFDERESTILLHSRLANPLVA